MSGRLADIEVRLAEAGLAALEIDDVEWLIAQLELAAPLELLRRYHDIINEMVVEAGEAHERLKSYRSRVHELIQAGERCAVGAGREADVDADLSTGDGDG